MEISPNIIPVGTIVVFVGILPFCRDEDGLAAVISHGDCSLFLIIIIFFNMSCQLQKLDTLVNIVLS